MDYCRYFLGGLLCTYGLFCLITIRNERDDIHLIDTSNGRITEEQVTWLKSVIIDHVALAKKSDNRFGSVHLSVRLSVCALTAENVKM